jgi:hypothetical protein
MRTSAVLAALLGIGLSTGTAVDAKPAAPAGKAAGAKKKLSPPACGARILPLVQGNTWTYVYVQAQNQILPELVKLAPPQASKIVIKVTKIETKGADTVATLEEKVSYELENKLDPKKPIVYENTINSTIKCNKTKFEISPDSFFFAAEPGGYRELEFDSLDRSRDTSLKLTNGSFGEAPWREDIVAKFKRTPAKDSKTTLATGKLELERSFTPEANQDLSTVGGDIYRQTEKLALVTTGRIMLDNPYRPKDFKNVPVTKSELPANWLSRFWFAQDVGVVQTQNMYAHQFQLKSYELN